MAKEREKPIVLTNISTECREKIYQTRLDLMAKVPGSTISFGETVESLIMPKDMGEVSDGYHTFNELYEHRIVNFMALCRSIERTKYHKILPVWKSKKHSDGSVWEGWFLLGIGTTPGEQITYHLPEKYWDLCEFDALDQAPEFDGHTSADVLERISKL